MSDLPTVGAADGRRLAVSEWGDPGGRPVFSLHGTPGSRLRRPPNEHDVRDAGIRLLTYDRPGYGGSDRQPGRRVVDCVTDLSSIADALGLERFHILGGSGGAPHALAAGARLSDRVLGVEALVSPAPRDRYDADWFAGMDAENVTEFGWALAGEEVLHRELTKEAAELLEQLSADDDHALSDYELAEADVALMQRDDVAQSMREMAEEAFRTGVWGWFDDDIALLEPWGFDLDEIAVPVTVRYGSQDVLVPAAHGAWVGRQVPGARVVVDESGGHMVSPEAMLTILTELVDGV